MTQGISRIAREQLGAPFTAQLETMRLDNPGVIAALVCTSDGFAVASAHSDEETSRRLAAIVSSLHALGVAVVEDMTLGRYGHLSIEASNGKCILFDLPASNGELLLGAIADGSLLLGKLLAVCRASREELDLLLRQMAPQAGPAHAIGLAPSSS
jgi:predicted regulator of Ras-like GTPase activity (Roadblock/LC7/MglB family)